MATRQTFPKSLFANAGIVASMENLQVSYVRKNSLWLKKLFNTCTTVNTKLFITTELFFRCSYSIGFERECDSMFETGRSTGYQNGKVTAWVKCGSDSGVRGKYVAWICSNVESNQTRRKSAYATSTKKRTTLHVLKLTFYDICPKKNFPDKCQLLSCRMKKGFTGPVSRAGKGF